ncbi:hypothetical protein E6C70_09810 [Glaciibacter flavus]|uniref:Uncharacterized protein n=1 Tax=Orlajensenia flava TaxID=2565934 RepID=A0A4V3WU52_9MICO|nr:hypothetical protein [Glaciibacter flavus]THG34537.1 hypothetical protein E6C70_09810 [Glaciibacter flavus]
MDSEDEAEWNDGDEWQLGRTRSVWKVVCVLFAAEIVFILVASPLFAGELAHGEPIKHYSSLFFGLAALCGIATFGLTAVALGLADRRRFPRRRLFILGGVAAGSALAMPLTLQLVEAAASR